MSTETPSNVAASPPHEAQSSTPPPSPKPAPPKRKVARKKTSAKDDLEEARKKIKEGREAEARALARIALADKKVRAQAGRDCVADLVGRLDKTTREAVIASLLSVAQGKEMANVQEWVETL